MTNVDRVAVDDPRDRTGQPLLRDGRCGRQGGNKNERAEPGAQRSGEWQGYPRADARKIRVRPRETRRAGFEGWFLGSLAFVAIWTADYTGSSIPTMKWIEITRRALAYLVAFGIGLVIGVFVTAVLGGNPNVTNLHWSEVSRNVGFLIGGVMGGIVAIIALGFHARRTRSMELQQTTDAFIRAVEQLGDGDSEARRLGGIHALVRLAHQVPQEHGPILEVLCGFVRNRAPKTPDHKLGRFGGKAVADGSQGDAEERDDSETSESTNFESSRLWPALEIEAALNAIGDMHRGEAGRKLVLREAALDRATFVGNFDGADFFSASLRSAMGQQASFRGASFIAADLHKCVFESCEFGGAIFTVADLSFAALDAAKLGEATFIRASLQCTSLEYANLTNAVLTVADLRNAKLGWAKLSGAMFDGAQLDGADFRDSDVTSDQIRRAWAVDPYSVKLPKGVREPPFGTPEQFI